ncbi:MAG: SUMF1/EgtB/PvdO family nonheme iron enzyme [Bauldia sp.]
MANLARALGALFFTLAALFGAAGAAHAEKRVALVVGNSAYKNVAALANPVADARLIGKALEADGFTVTLAESLGREAFAAALRTFRAEADTADWALVYYAGHGMEVGGVNYLVPVDARLSSDRDVPDEAVALDRVLAAVEGARTLRMVVLDACRTNPFLAARPNGARSASRGLAAIEPAEATLVAYSAKAGTIAIDGAGANSPFAEALARRLAEPGLEIGKLFRFVRDDVMEATRRQQEPFTYGSLPARDFFFKPPGAEAGPPPPEVAAVLRDPRLAEARQLWDTLRSSTSIEALESFAARFPGTDYAALAGIRLGELRRAPGGEGGCGERRLAAAGNDPAVAAPCRKPGEVFRDCAALCPEMVAIPAGSFAMGSAAGEAGRGEDEAPVRRVTLPAFAVGKLEVTRGEFEAFVGETGYRAGNACRVHLAGAIAGGILERNPFENAPRNFRDPGFAQDDSHPVVCVNFDDASAYVAWLAQKTGQPYRLLSEAEFEYATRAGTATPYWFGEAAGDACAFANGPDRSAEEQFPAWWSATADCRDGAVYTAPAGSLRANPFGLHDMIGNAAEWVADCYRDTYAGAPADGQPVTRGDCRYRVLRGGSWYLGGQTLSAASRILRSASRDYLAAGTRDSAVGFRVARALAP